MSSLFRSSAIVSVMTLCSRVLGLLRDLLIAAVFGAGLTTDVFFVAFLIPNMFRRIFAEGAFSKGFIPVFNGIKTQQDMSSLQRFANAIFWRLTMIVGLLVLLGVLFANYVIPIFAREFVEYPAAFAQAIDLLQVMFPYLLLLSIAAFFTGILNSYQQFLLPALGPVLLNVVMVSTLVWCIYQVSPQINWLAWAVIVGGCLHVAVLIRPIMKLGFLPKLDPITGHTSVKRVMILMLPVILGSSAVQISQIINTQLNTSVGPGAPSWFYYADRLFQFPVGMFGVAIGTVILPRLSVAHSSKSSEDFSATMQWALRLIVIIALPSAVGLFVLADEMSITLYQRGAFEAYDAQMTANALAAMAMAVIGYMLVQVFAAAHYAQQDTRKPAIIGVIAVVVNVLVGVSLIDQYGHVATALAVSVSSLVNALLLALTLSLPSLQLRSVFFGSFMGKVLISTLIMAFLAHMLAAEVSTWQAVSQWMRIGWLFGIIGVCGGLYILLLQISGLRLQQLWRYK